MASAESVKQSIAEAKGDILGLMQETDTEWGFDSQAWADEMYRAYELLTEAGQAIDRARDLE